MGELVLRPTFGEASWSLASDPSDPTSGMEVRRAARPGPDPTLTPNPNPVPTLTLSLTLSLILTLTRTPAPTPTLTLTLTRCAVSSTPALRRSLHGAHRRARPPTHSHYASRAAVRIASLTIALTPNPDLNPDI